MGLRRQSREIALKALYLIDVTGVSTEDAINIVIRENEFLTKIKDFFLLLVKGTIENKSQIDQLISKYTENWELSRMSTVDRNILRIGTYEILKTLETPINVIINEAVEIAKKYSTEDSGKFVNGILDKIKHVRIKSDINEN